MKRLVPGLSPHRGGQDGRGRARPALHPAAQAPGAESAGQVLSAGRLMNDFVHCGTENTLLLFLHKCASKSLSLLLLFAGSNCTRILFSASREVLVGLAGHISGLRSPAHLLVQDPGWGGPGSDTRLTRPLFPFCSDVCARAVSARRASALQQLPSRWPSPN